MISLGAGCLKGDSFELWRPERDVSRSRGKMTAVVSAAVALALLIAFIPGSLRQFLRLVLQQLVEGFYYIPAYSFLALPLDYFLV